MRELAEQRQPGSAPTESRNEDRFEGVLADAGIPAMARQRAVGGSAPIGRVDFSDLELPLVAEVNSLAHHSLPSDQRADEIRYAALVEAGFTVAVLWENDLWSRPSNVVETVRESRSRARRGEASVVHSHSCPWPEASHRIVVRSFVPPTRG